MQVSTKYSSGIPPQLLIVNTVDECLSKMSVVEELLEWENIFSSFDGCKGTLNDWKFCQVLSIPNVRGVEELVLK